MTRKQTTYVMQSCEVAQVRYCAEHQRHAFERVVSLNEIATIKTFLLTNLLRVCGKTRYWKRVLEEMHKHMLWKE